MDDAAAHGPADGDPMGPPPEGDMPMDGDMMPPPPDDPTGDDVV
jgi:hypothetical protein